MSKLTKCNTCGGMVAKDAKSCPHCGAQNKKKLSCSQGLIGCLFWIIVIIGLIVYLDNRSTEKREEEKKAKEQAENLEQQLLPELEQKLSYLSDNPAISIFNLDNHKIYIKLKNNRLPNNYKSICDDAAIMASKTFSLTHQSFLNNTFTAYLLSPNGSIYDNNQVLYKSEAKNGEIVQSDLTEHGEEMWVESMSPKEKEIYMAKKAKERLAYFKKNFVEYDNAVTPAVLYIQKQMHNPDSFEHVKTTWEPVADDNELFLVHMTFRGTNMLNAVVLQNADLLVSYKGEIYTN